MMDWFDPRNFSEWAQRIYSPRSIVMLLLILGFLISELRFDWLEKVSGAYLVSTNSNRPESGTIWEIGQKTIKAQHTLEQIATDRMSSQREALGAESFAEIAASITLDQGVMLSSDQFRKLYLKLSPLMAQEIASPFELLKLFNDERLDRIYFEKAGDGLKVYFLDHQNRVLRKLRITPALLHRIEQGETALQGPLENFDNFRNRIYQADRFFYVLASLPEDLRRSVVSQPEIFLNISGFISRIGISDEAVSGFIQLGFEIEDASGLRVIMIKGREWAVWHLRSQLEDKMSPFSILGTPGNVK
jgi:hypothetical protein